MISKQTQQKIIPFITLFALIGLLAWELFYARPQELPSALIGEDIPAFTLPNIFPSHPDFQSTDIKTGVVLLNVWASWCYACNLEHEMLMKIKNQYHVRIFSINYKDNIQDATKWLAKNGNPYIITGEDTKGDAAIDLGVYGTPETFVIRDGKIIYRHVGIIDEKSWNEVLYPLIKKYGG